MNGLLGKCKHVIEKIIFRALWIFPIDDKKVLFESEGDFTDNSYALYDYMMKNGYSKKYRLIWLTDPAFRSNSIETIPKWVHGVSFKRLYVLSTAKYFFLDHNNILSDYPRRKGQMIINLFHGCTFKKAKAGSNVTNTENIMLVTGDFWKPIMSCFVSCSIEKTKSLGYPRNDYLFTKKNHFQHDWIKKHHWDRYGTIIIWMPTFRKSNNMYLSENYYNGETGLPILETSQSIEKLNQRLKELNTLIVCKIHHLQKDYPVFKKLLSNIQMLTDIDIISDGLQLYQIIALTDALITDYSSISNDYMLLDRPMIFTLDDYEEYRSSRGFSVDDPAQYFPGHHVYNEEEFFKAIEDISNDLDYYKEKRHELLPIMHKYQDGNSSERIIEHIGLCK